MRAFLVLVLLVMSLLPCMAQDVTPITLTFNNFVGEASSAASLGTFFHGSELWLTNIVAYGGTTTNSAVEDLTGDTIGVRIGTQGESSSNSVGAAQIATNGTYSAKLICPTNGESAVIQTTISGGGKSRIYPLKLITLEQPLQ